MSPSGPENGRLGEQRIIGECVQDPIQEEIILPVGQLSRSPYYSGETAPRSDASLATEATPSNNKNITGGVAGNVVMGDLIINNPLSDQRGDLWIPMRAFAQ